MNGLFSSSDGLKLENLRHAQNTYVTGHYDKENIAENFLTVLLPMVAMETSTKVKCVTSYLGANGLTNTLTRQLNVSIPG